MNGFSLYIGLCEGQRTCTVASFLNCHREILADDCYWQAASVSWFFPWSLWFLSQHYWVLLNLECTFVGYAGFYIRAIKEGILFFFIFIDYHITKIWRVIYPMVINRLSQVTSELIRLNLVQCHSIWNKIFWDIYPRRKIVLWKFLINLKPYSARILLPK